MLIENLIDVPNEVIVNQFIPKNEIFSMADMNNSDKKFFKDYIKQIRWMYKFSEESIRIKPYKTEEKNYLEAELINIKLKDENFQVYNHNTGNYHRYDARLDRIVDIILRFIPYPTVLSVEFKNEIKFYVSHISESLADFEKITLDEIINTDWIKTNDLDSFDKELINNLQLNNLDKKNIYTFYDSIVSAIIKYNGSKEIGQNIELDSEKIQEIMNKINDLNRKINDLRSKIKKEPNFNKKLEYNIMIKNLEMDVKILQEKLI